MGRSIIDTIAGRLGSLLNKPTNPNLVNSLVTFYRRNNSLQAFSVYLETIGLSDKDACKEVFDLINDNIASIEKADSAAKGSRPPLAPAAPASAKATTKKKPLAISFDEDEDEELLTQPQGIILKRNPKPHKPLSISFSDDEDNTSEVIPKPKPTFKFKKIKKEDAMRIKSEGGLSEPSASSTEASVSIAAVKPKASASLAELAEKDRQLTQANTDENAYETTTEDEGFDLHALYEQADSLENDRVWYTHEDNGYVEEPEPDELRAVSRSRRVVREDDELSDQSRIPIVSHNLIPSFLEDSREHLTLQLQGGARGIGPTINPVKDPGSELAVVARQGSQTVKDRRVKHERSQRAKERTGQVEDEVSTPENPRSKRLSGPTASSTSTAEKRKEAIQESRKSLPVFAVRNELVKTISENQVTIVIGETGSGKTTQLAQYLYEEGLTGTNPRRLIGCTQPRRVAAMSVAKRVSEEMDCKLGEEVGYSIRFEDVTHPTKTMIKYLTEGILLRELLADPLLEHYSCVIMDEAHERSLNTDVLLGLFKQLLSRRKDFKLIVTSATMNADRFVHYFGQAPRFTIPGRTYPVDVLFGKGGGDYVEQAVKQVLTVHLGTGEVAREGGESSWRSSGDILVFMTGQEDIETTCSVIQEKLDLLENPPPLDILPIYSTLPQDLQAKIFAAPDPCRRKVVVATNIAETSLTVDGIRYVIDTGLVKMKVYNPKLGMDTLQVIPISLANAQQRSGRAGRTGPGTAYRLYTEKASEDMYLQPIPEIQRTNLTNVMLLLKSLKINDIAKFPFLDSPPMDLLASSLYDLWAMGAVDNLGDLTGLGHAMITFPMEPSLAKLILLSCDPRFHCSHEIITVVSMLSVPGIFSRPKERAREADAAREKFYISESDHLTLANVYDQWEVNLGKVKGNYARINAWCNKNFLQLKSLLRAKDIRNQLLLIMKTNKLPVLRSRSDEDVKKCLAASFYHQSAKLAKVNLGGTPEFINMRHTYMKMYLHPTSALNGSSLSNGGYVVYHELVLTSKEYMNYVTCVNPVWLLEFGYKFFDVSDQYKKGGIDFEFEYHSRNDTERQIGHDLEVIRARQVEVRKRGKGHVGPPRSAGFKRRAI